MALLSYNPPVRKLEVEYKDEFFFYKDPLQCCFHVVNARVNFLKLKYLPISCSVILHFFTIESLFITVTAL